MQNECSRVDIRPKYEPGHFYKVPWSQLHRPWFKIFLWPTPSSVWRPFFRPSKKIGLQRRGPMTYPPSAPWPIPSPPHDPPPSLPRVEFYREGGGVPGLCNCGPWFLLSLKNRGYFECNGAVGRAAQKPPWKEKVRFRRVVNLISMNYKKLSMQIPLKLHEKFCLSLFFDFLLKNDKFALTQGRRIVYWSEKSKKMRFWPKNDPFWGKHVWGIRIWHLFKKNCISTRKFEKIIC